MASASDMTDIEAKIAANWTRCEIRRIDLDQELPDDGAEFLAVAYPLPGTERQRSLQAGAATLFILEGAAFRVTLVAPKSKSVADGFLHTAAGDLDALRKALRGRFGISSRMHVYATEGPADPQDDGVNWQISCTFLYRRYGN